MAAIQEAIAAYFRSSSMVNSITNVQWMDTGKNGAPPLMISQEPESGDCVSISIISFTPECSTSAFPVIFFFTQLFNCKGNGI